MAINNEKTVFSDEEQNLLYQTEADSWWFQYRAKVITGIMYKYFHKEDMTVDVGGGNGYTTTVAQKKGFRMGLLEPSGMACRNAIKRGIEAHEGFLCEEYPKDDEYKQVLLLDVLEHIENDEGFLELLYQKIDQEGLLLITVPAYQKLWSSEDDYANHYRRYTEKELNKLARDTGFEIVYSSYFFQFLFLPILFGRVALEKMGLLKRQEDRTEEERKEVMEKQFKTSGKGIVDRVLHTLEKREYQSIMRGHYISYGASVIMVLKK